MSFPASLTVRTVKGHFVTYPDGVPAMGSVRIVLDNAMQGPSDDLIVAPFDVLQQFNRDNNGRVSFRLPANNDPQWTPALYRIVVTFCDGPTHRQTLLVGYDSTDDIDLSDVLNIPAGDPGQAYVLLSTVGLPGGIPGPLDENGKMPTSQLPAGAGGDTEWDDILDKPDTFPPSAHTHTTGQVTGLDTALASKASESELSSGLSTKANTVHTHVTSDVTGLDTALAAKASTAALASGLSTKADTTALDTGLAGKANTVHAHISSDVSDFSEAVQDVVGNALISGSNVDIIYNDSTGKTTISSTGGGGGGSGGLAYLWDGSAYVESTSAIYVGPVDPTTVASPESGSFWYVTDDDTDPGGGGGPVADGDRVTGTGQVGYLGATHDSDHTLNVGDTIPAELTGARWDETVFRVDSGHDNFVIDGWHINAGVDCYSTNLTVKNCVITPPAGTAYYGVLCRSGDVLVQDSTIIGGGTSGELAQCVSLDGTGSITVKRCDLSGFQDAVGILQGLISQVHIHDVALAGSFHSDGIQIFGGGTLGTTIEHSLIDITGPAGSSTDNEHQNACIYTDAPSGPTTGLIINNCQINGGTYEVMLSAAPQDVHITNCDFGPVDSSGIGTITADPGTQMVEWSNNHDSTGTLMTDPTA